MKRAFTVRNFSLLLVLALVLGAVLPGAAVQAQAPDGAVPGAVLDVAAADGAYAPGRLIVGVDAGQTGSMASMATMQTADALAALDAQVITADDPCVADAVAAGAGAGLAEMPTAVQSWQVAPGREDEAIALLLQQPGVRFAARDALLVAAQEEIVEPAAAEAAQLAAEFPYTVNDPLYMRAQWGPQRANFPRAWQLLPAGSALTAVRVAVIDSGVDFNHPDLAGQLLPGKNYIDAGSQPVDDNGHGTHVAGIIAALTNNGQGIAGSAPKVQIDPRKVLRADGTGNAASLRYAICDATRDGARVINMSVQFLTSVGSSLYITLREAMQFAEARGVLLVAAGGNNRSNPQVYYPALFDEVMAVAALNINNERADYSAVGSKVEIAAPGGDDAGAILSTWPSAQSVRDLCDAGVQSGSGWYCAEYGTSMASPYVVGAAALVLSINPALTGAEVRAILKETAVDVGLPTTQQGAGLLDVAAAVRWLTRSGLQATLTGASRSVAFGSAPYTATLLLRNPSAEPVAVSGVVTGSNWLSVTGLSGPNFSGALAYGEPLVLPVVVSPTALLTGTYTGQIPVTVTRRDGSTVRSTPTFFVAVGTALRQLYFPQVLLRTTPQASGATATALSWETPISPTVHALTSTESVNIALPFAFPLSGPAGTETRSYTQARIYADGFVTFPDAETVAIANPGQNRCLPWFPGGLQGVFGWWADLNAGASGAEVSSFRPAADRFVIQYKEMASVGVTPAYRVTFQIVLYQNGDVQLNYQQAPAPWSPRFDQVQPQATVGVQARNGLYRNQVACVTGDTLLGSLPQAGQSLRIKSGEVY